MTDQARLDRRTERERLARKEAESLLEIKSRELYEVNQALAEKEANTRSILEAISDGILTYTPDGIIQTSNRAARELFQTEGESLEGCSISKLFPDAGFIGVSVEPHTNITQVVTGRRSDTDSFPCEVKLSSMALGGVWVPIITVRDITQQKLAQEQIRRLAYYDSLSGLPNRTLFQDRSVMAMNSASRHQELAALMFLDLDRFKRINDTLGHGTGDLLLRQISERLKSIVRCYDSVAAVDNEEYGPVLARLGGDEFTLLFQRIRNSNDVARKGQRILEGLRRPIVIKGRQMVITASIGIALFPEDGEDFEMLLRNADTAMYQAKKTGRDQAMFYSTSMNKEALRVLGLEQDLHQALAQGEFEVHYQPKISIKTRRLVGAEALIRWRHPQRGLISPGEFLPVAEDTGQIGPISDWVLIQVCQQIRQWLDKGLKPVQISVNISNQQFNSGRLLDTVRQVLAETGLESRYLELELTESIVMENAQQAVETLNQFREIGISLSIDDFGTGYSSMSYLKRLSVDKLKIDRSFIRDIASGSEEEAIIRAIIALAQSLRLRVIAEGVETEEQMRHLQQEGCDEVQGFLFSPAIEGDAFESLLK
ncbi:MAG: EAL domain-containing protein [Candidatus Thiodiazotropha endolucinida]